ncbi:hypothetical protein JM16_004861 [Phytophthora kernoviae]|uniref:non-specific serine/threonine protein kinase n=1 Tax=Phytophthora kernoviae TaxID=325452 RepID=A0A8T0LYF5_9STRA|nr:hypothetical protein JM16_004861 [Phytophthora kernoviae]
MPIVWSRSDDDNESRSRKAYAPGTIAVLPLSMQIAFRRKMLSIFGLQLMLLTALVAALTYEATLSKFTRDKFKVTMDLAGPLLGSIVSLGAVYFVRTHFPLNYVMVTVFSFVLSLLVAGVQTWLDTPAGLFCCGFTFMTVCVMIILSGISYRYEGDTIPTGPSAGQASGSDGEVVLRSSLFSGCIAFTVSAVISIILYGILGGSDGFVTLRALGYSLALELVLIVWFSYDASSMYSILTPDEYMSGVVYFYVDLIVLSCAAFFLAGVMFVAAMFCPTASFGYCNCNGCLCFSRNRQEEENDDGGVIPYEVDSDVHEEAVEPVPEVSADKQKQIVRRVRAIVTVLQDSLLLKDTLREIRAHFELDAVKVQAGEEGTRDTVDHRPTLVGYGLGSFCASSNAVHQLGFLVALNGALREYHTNVDANDAKNSVLSQHKVEIFDPAMNKSDAAILQHFEIGVIEENEHGRRRVDHNTVFFMPHCGKGLYQNVLACNWGPAVKKIIVIGNSFSAYGDRVLSAIDREGLVLVDVLPYLKEVSLSYGVSKTHEDFTRYEAAFNDMSLHSFPSNLTECAFRDDVKLTKRMAALASAAHGPNTPRAGNNNYARELEASNLAAGHHRTNVKDNEGSPEEPEDKSGVSAVFSPRHEAHSITEHYAITRHLGEGSYSTVKQVTHRKKGGFYACKIVDKLSLSDVDRSALSHEVRVLSSVSHANIMRLYEVIEDDAKCYLVTELAEGGDLFDRIVKQGKFPEREAQKVAAALVEALHYCHTHSIVHRDVKPENVLLSGDDVKLCDFGFARQLSHPEEQASDSCGTPGYAAPEILDGRSYGLEVDVFSLGVVTYIMLCGYPPFPMKLAQLRTHRFNVRYPSKDWAAIHPDVKTLISKMLHVDPTERPPMAELRSHPWIQVGRATLERLRREGEERRRLADLTRRQQAASAIRKKLVIGGFEAVKYGRNGLPHRTKLRLSTDGKCLSWQPKLLKRSLLRYQNARGFTSLFGIGGKEHSSNSQPDLHSPQIADDRIPNGGMASNDHDESEQSTGTTSASPPRSADSSNSCASPSSSTSDAINEKRLWWRSLRRERGTKTERTASGGFTLNFSSRAESNPSSPVSPMASPKVQVMTPSATSPLDDSIKLNDIREMLTGDNASFFAGHATNLPNTAKRAVDPACVLSVCTRFRELHLEFPNEGSKFGWARKTIESINSGDGGGKFAILALGSLDLSPTRQIRK